MSLVVQEAQRHAQEIKARLFKPTNAVVDLGIDLKRKVIPIKNAEIPQEVPVTTLDVFGPKLASLEDMAFGPIISAPTQRAIWIGTIQEKVCARYHMPINEVMSHRRTAEVVRARHIAMYLCRKLTTRSMPEIGRMFGGKDHTVILHAFRKIERLRQEDAQLNAELIELAEAITA